MNGAAPGRRKIALQFVNVCAACPLLEVDFDFAWVKRKMDWDVITFSIMPAYCYNGERCLSGAAF